MRKFIETLQNIWKIEELRTRILITLGFLLVYRFGTFVILPGIEPQYLDALKQQTSSGLLGLLDTFSGGAFSNASIFALGIMPYISASIVIQLLTIAIPYFQRLQREGESGRRKVNQITRFLTVGILLMQAPAYLTNLSMNVARSGFELNAQFYFASFILLIAGSMFIMWLGERITDRGIGNGISMIIMIGIIARFPNAFIAEIGSRLNETSGGIIAFIVEMILLYLVFVAVILLVQGTRKIPVQYAKRVVGNKQYGGVRQYIPLKINAAGVMPIIFAQALIMLPIMLLGYSQSGDGILGSIRVALSNTNGFSYNLLMFLMVVAFTYFYTAITVNAVQMADDMKRNGGFIPGVKPGKQTAEYIDTIMSRITLPGSIFLGIVTILPTFAILLGINNNFAHFFGGTTLLILVGVILDTLQQIESRLLMRHYDGLVKNGRIKGRSGN